MATEKQVAIERIEIKIGRKTISLSLTEFRELKKMLDDLFPKETIYKTEKVFFPAIPRDPYKHWLVSSKDVEPRFPTKYTATCEQSRTLLLTCAKPQLTA